jgi:hypothetical protein
MGTRRMAALGVVGVALAGAGAASAYGVRTVTLRPGRCVTVTKTRVCAARARPPATVTVAPSPIGQTFTGSGEAVLAPFTLAHGAMLHWSFTNDPDGLGFAVYYEEGGITNGNASSGQSYLAPDTYTLTIDSEADWTISF